jgi:hypothetical protein
MRNQPPRSKSENTIVGWHCSDCEGASDDEEMLPDCCPMCGGTQVSFSYADDHEWAEADRMRDEEKVDEVP